MDFLFMSGDLIRFVNAGYKLNSNLVPLFGL